MAGIEGVFAWAGLTANVAMKRASREELARLCSVKCCSRSSWSRKSKSRRDRRRKYWKTTGREEVVVCFFYKMLNNGRKIACVHVNDNI